MRVRSRPLDQIDRAKLALALTLMAKRLHEAAKLAATETEPVDEAPVAGVEEAA